MYSFFQKIFFNSTVQEFLPEFYTALEPEVKEGMEIVLADEVSALVGRVMV